MHSQHCIPTHLTAALVRVSASVADEAPPHRMSELHPIQLSVAAEAWMKAGGSSWSSAQLVVDV